MMLELVSDFTPQPPLPAVLSVAPWLGTAVAGVLLLTSRYGPEVGSPLPALS